MASKQPKVLFLDVGGVLLTNGWGHESRQAAAKEFNINYEEFNRLHDGHATERVISAFF